MILIDNKNIRLYFIFSLFKNNDNYLLLTTHKKMF